ncbi:NAD-dependent epimerase/dehydratase family protein [Mucilaginibacter sp. UR6-11]|uniref:NAD-dependent epimerase/dehydratase family protein n=1 Tax=Mucilaginibacter sp. UR6-11 TaxID=1435644 RepID=UPI001E2ACAD2|nr:NAD-dependent epimerase/dehydratase family protein [Mucilaginibacter sp. UR6-11]MCC8424855.1 NAD-dependent epimerase/dehydratase family protein [Mucilaginibacter sp. UR6-11]
MKILITGCAGFIGFHLTDKLTKLGYNVVGLDNLNDYYDAELKVNRLKHLGITVTGDNVAIKSDIYDNLRFIKMNLEDKDRLPALFLENKFDIVCNLAAQAGVRYSIEKPFKYIDSNIVGFLNVLEACRNHNVTKLIYASSSSIYGMSENVPFSTKEVVDKPISLYAATKKSNELMAYTYSHLFNIKTIGLRFFTVYGPWGRPDMAMHLFTDAILNGKAIKVFNDGKLSRDFTYIDDIVSGVVATITLNNQSDDNYQLYNIGNSQPVQLTDFISQIELCTGKKAIKNFLPMQPGDVEKTWADIESFKNEYHYEPKTSIEIGVKNYVQWHKAYYKQ